MTNRLLGDIRARVKQALTRSSAFNALPADKRTEIAHNTVRAFHYILGGADGQLRPGAVTLAGNSTGYTPLAQAQAGGARAPVSGTPIAPLRPQQPPPIGEAARRGGEAMADLIQEVDFPAFVGGLVDGVFNSIVTSSIKQMEELPEHRFGIPSASAIASWLTWCSGMTPGSSRISASHSSPACAPKK